MDSHFEPSHREVTVRSSVIDGSGLAVFEFEGELRQMMISSLRASFLATGNYTPDARAISSQGAMSLGVAGAAAGATAISAALSPTLYMATANPATLMALGNGVGSAVMGAGGIVAHAPFIAVASALPVVAPILAVQALSTAVMMHQFKKMDRKLDAVKATLDRSIARTEATHAGELIAASRIVDDVYSQYSLDGEFSHDMLVRLALAERDVKALALRYRQLVESRVATNVEDLDEVRQANFDAHAAMLASFVALRVSFLRICVDMQENPRSVISATEQLKATIDDGIEFWTRLQNRSRDIKERIDQIEAERKGKNRAQQLVPGTRAASLGKELAKGKDAYALIMESEREVMNEFHSLIESASATRQALEKSTPTDGSTSPTIVCWADELGEHAFVTERSLITV